MKKSKFIILLSSLLLMSCSSVNFITNSTGKTSSSNSSVTSSNSASSSSETNSSVDSSSTSSGPKEGDIQIYALNDFHGACVASGNEAGILKVGSFFKQKGSEDNTLIPFDASSRGK